MNQPTPRVKRRRSAYSTMQSMSGKAGKAGALVTPAFRTVSYYLPTPLADSVDKAAALSDGNKSAVVSTALAEYFGIAVEAGGESVEAA